MADTRSWRSLSTSTELQDRKSIDGINIFYALALSFGKNRYAWCYAIFLLFPRLSS